MPMTGGPSNESFELSCRIVSCKSFKVSLKPGTSIGDHYCHQSVAGPAGLVVLSQSLLLCHPRCRISRTSIRLPKKRRQSRILPRPCQNECPSRADPGFDEGGISDDR